MLAPYKIYFDRYLQFNRGNEGVMSVKDKDGLFIFEKLPFLSGSKAAAGSSWIVGRSPIPLLKEVGSKKLYLHIGKMNKNGERHPITKMLGGIGWFIPISDSLKEFWTISGEGGKRTFIGIHPDNGVPGSQGCPVFVVDTWQQRLKVELFYDWVEKLLKRGFTAVEVWVG